MPEQTYLAPPERIAATAVRLRPRLPPEIEPTGGLRRFLSALQRDGLADDFVALADLVVEAGADPDVVASAIATAAATWLHRHCGQAEAARVLRDLAGQIERA